MANNLRLNGKMTKEIVFLACRKRVRLPLQPRLSVKRVTSLRILSITVNDKLAAADHVTTLLLSCNHTLYVMYVLCAWCMLAMFFNEMFLFDTFFTHSLKQSMSVCQSFKKSAPPWLFHSCNLHQQTRKYRCSWRLTFVVILCSSFSSSITAQTKVFSEEQCQMCINFLVSLAYIIRGASACQILPTAQMAAEILQLFNFSIWQLFAAWMFKFGNFNCQSPVEGQDTLTCQI